MFFKFKKIMEKEKDLYLSDYQSIKRLLMEWVRHGELIIAYDYDNTVFDYHETGQSFDLIIELLQRCDKIGAKFIVYSCSPKDRHPEMNEYLKSVGLRVDYINKPHIELADGTGKLFYNILLDDRAGLRSSFIILDKTVDIMESKPNTEEEACILLNHRFGKGEIC